MQKRALRLLLPCLLIFGSLIWGQEITFTTRTEWATQDAKRSAAGVVVWLVPEDDSLPSASAPGNTHPRLVQKNKTFQPHVLVVPVGSVVEFPNRDPFFHNVFSLFEGKRFDLGLYEAGTTREVHFNRPGVSYIFCNIHPEMSAVVIAVPTAHYAISDSQGEVIIPNLAAGRYTLHLWYEGMAPDKLEAQTRDVAISGRNSSLGILRLAAGAPVEAHKNKYGRDYEPPTPPTAGYSQQ